MTKKASGSPMRVALWVGGGVAVVLLILSMVQVEEPGSAINARIDKACTREFPHDEEARMNCKITLSVRALQKIEDGKWERAVKGAGLD